MNARRFTLLPILIVLSLTLLAPSAHAQDTPANAQNVISANPFLAAFGWYTGEYERVLSPKYSIGISGSYVALGESGDDEVIYSGVDITPRLYPQENAPGGLFFGGRIGMRKVEEEVSDFFVSDTVTVNETTFTAIGFEIGFTYLFGVNRNYALSVGAGVMKLFGGDDLDDASTTLPTIRVVNLGIAF